ncbi:MAG: serine/threonine-protein kinase, partial [Rubrivivax sp.]|nr:serine/threonine-protein kinase [Rubrivivax sp.]
MNNSSDGSRERAEQRTLLMPRRDQGSHLPKGSTLQEFVVEQVLGLGGYSIVYLARDTKLDRRVAVKEYLPGTLAMRAPSGEVVARLPRFEESYQKGLQSFINEARLLGSFDHPSLVKVYRFWADKGTAYMAMPYYNGTTLKKWLVDLGAPPSERWLRQLAEPLMQALAVLHDNNCLHRDVAPDNILMLYDRAGGNFLEQQPRPVLLDFGAARRVAAEATQNLTSILKSGYSPVEQYDNEAGLRQGTWSDVYALCAVLYAAAIGKVPNASIARLVRDDLIPARVAGKGRYSQAFLAAIDAGLSVRPEQRPQTMAELQAWFKRPEPAAEVKPDRTVPVPETSTVDLQLEPPAPPTGSRTRWVPVIGGLLLALVLA